MSQMESNTPTVQAPPMLTRVRFTYARGEALRYISHLDMQLVWERTLRRAALPLAFSQGFNPRPRMHMASALPLGFLSRCELFDVWLSTDMMGPDDLASLKVRVQAAAPPGLELLQIELVSLQEAALQTQVQSAEYQAIPLDPMDESTLREAVTRLLAAESLPRERRNKPYDLRPLIETLRVQAAEDTESLRPSLWMVLSAREGATGRPEEVLDALGLDPASFRVERTRLVLGT